MFSTSGMLSIVGRDVHVWNFMEFNCTACLTVSCSVIRCVVVRTKAVGGHDML